MTVHRGTGVVWDYDPELTTRGVLPQDPDRRHALLSRLALEIREVGCRITPNDVRLFKAVMSAGSVQGAAELLESDKADPERYLRKRLGHARGLIRAFMHRTVSGRLLLGVWDLRSKDFGAPGSPLEGL